MPIRNIILLDLFLFLMVFTMSCKTHKSDVVVESPLEPEIEISDKGKAEEENLVISFYSIGSGIDNQALASFTEYLNDKGIKYKQVSWGREGEQDLCFLNVDLQAIGYKTFIAEVQSILIDKEHVSISEYTKCRK